MVGKRSSVKTGNAPELVYFFQQPILGYSLRVFRRLPRKEKKRFVARYGAKEYRSCQQYHRARERSAKINRVFAHGGPASHSLATIEPFTKKPVDFYGIPSDVADAFMWSALADAVTTGYPKLRAGRFEHSFVPHSSGSSFVDRLWPIRARMIEAKLLGDTLSELEAQQQLLHAIETGAPRGTRSAEFGQYVLVDRVPVIITDAIAWQLWVQYADLVVARNDGLPDGASVSTIFLGLDHGLQSGAPPLLFETQVLDGPMDGDQSRWSTYAEALAGHHAVCASLCDL